MAEKVPWSMAVTSAAPRPLPETSAMTTAVRSGPSSIQVEIVAAHSQTGAVQAGHLEVREMAEPFWEQRLLDFTRDGEFLLQSSPFLFLLNQPGLVENACGLNRKSIQDFTVKRRKCGGARAVEVEHSQQLPGGVDRGGIARLKMHQ